jgi:hypothetical protein
LILVDELYFHRQRGLPRWEALGHPLDSLSVALPVAIAVFALPTSAAIVWYVSFAILSCLLVTKDEFLHARLCSPTEQWLHALLFVLHPIVLGAVAWLWLGQMGLRILQILLGLILGFTFYQFFYWTRKRDVLHPH